MKLAEVRKNYDAVSAYYDLATDLIFHRLLGLYDWRKRAIDRLQLRAGDTVLDIGCGTGNNFELIQQAVGSSGRIIGVDYSPGMLKRARRRCENAGWTNVVLLQDDVAQLDQVSQDVDACVSIWCLGIVHDLPAALRRMITLTRSGGRISILDFDRAVPADGPLRYLFPLYRWLLIKSGIDAPEDMNSDRLQRRWNEGRCILNEHLVAAEEERYLWDGGLLISGAVR